MEPDQQSRRFFLPLSSWFI